MNRIPSTSSLSDHRDILVIVPGLSGEHESGYIINMVIEGIKNDYQVVVINYRGENGKPMTVSNEYE